MEKENTNNRPLHHLASLGVAIVFALNLMAVFIFNKESALFFSHQWWSSWFPVYTVWLIFLIIKIGAKVKERQAYNSNAHIRI